MPESTIAIVGVAAEVPLDQNFWTPETNGQRCLFERLPASCIGASVVIAAMPFFWAMRRTWRTGEIRRNAVHGCELALDPLGGAAVDLQLALDHRGDGAGGLVGVTLDDHVERLRRICLRRLDQAGRRVRVPGGGAWRPWSRRERARRRPSRRGPRPGLPQSALERVSPFDGLPHRALCRSPPLAPRSSRIKLSPAPFPLSPEGRKAE